MRVLETLTVLLLAKVWRSESQEPYRPHILFVVMDDLGSNDLGYHGSGISTPVADEIATSGLMLKNFYVLPTCTMTRIALMTGRYPYRMGHYEVIRSNSANGLPLDEETVAQVLQTAGYQTHAVGKWHLGHARYEQTPTFRGFQSFFGFHVSGEQDYYQHVTLKDGKGRYDLRREVQEFCGLGCSKQEDHRGMYSSVLYGNEAARVVQTYDADRGPLFLYLAFQAVHFPLQVPRNYSDMYDWDPFKNVYAGMLTAADEAFGTVVDALKDKDLWSNTLVVYVTDNGGIVHDKKYGGEEVTLASNYPSRGEKRQVWQGGVLGEGFMGGPALQKLGIAGGKYNGIFHAVDWLPTLAYMTGASRQGRKKLDGVSQLKGLRVGKLPRKSSFLGYSTDGGSRQGKDGHVEEHAAILWTKWKLVRMPDQVTYKLYDLRDDPGETRDLASSRPYIVKLLKRKLAVHERAFLDPVKEDKTCPPIAFEQTDWGQKCWAPWC